MEYNKQMGTKLIIGLGNPGPEYEGTYHNVGVAALEQWLATVDPEAVFRKHGDHFAYAKSGGVIFVRPIVFMNESGVAASEAARAFDAKPEEILVLHDESDMPLGEYKLALGGSSAGHKGVQSIIDHLHTTDFWRGRIGIRNPKERTRKKAGDFVLNQITGAHKKILAEVFSELIATVEKKKTSY
jgi:PTH1 family peptidyl-tRNA hydrolase